MEYEEMAEAYSTSEELHTGMIERRDLEI